MTHAQSLRVVGQSLEMLRLRSFSLEKKGNGYIVRSDLLTATHEWILTRTLAENRLDSLAPEEQSTEPRAGAGWLYYGPLDIAQLNAQQEQKRAYHTCEEKHKTHTLAELLRTLGDHLDDKDAIAFQITWHPDSVGLEYKTPTGVIERKELTVKKLGQLAFYARFRRSSGTLSNDSR